MSVTTPLTTLADQQASAAAGAATAFAAQLQAEDLALPTIRAQQQSASAALSVDAQQEADLRRQLCAIAMPADSEPLVTALEAVLVTEQGDRATVDRSSDALDDAVRARAATAAAQAIAQAAAALATTAAALEHESAAQVEAWLTAAGSAPVTQAVTAAAAASGSAPYQAAQAHLKGILDTAASGTAMYDLFARRATEAAERAQAPVDSSAAALAARQALLATQSPAEGALAQAETGYAVQLARLQDLAENAVTGYAAAMATFTAIAAAAAPTAAETGAITAAVDDAKTLAPLEVGVHDANRALRAAQLALDEAGWSGIAADPAFDPQTDASLALERNAVTIRASDLQTAVDAFTAADPGHLDTYEAALPDQVKDQIVAFFGAAATLARIAGYGAAVPGDVQTAVTQLAAARTAAADLQASAARLDQAVAEQAGTAAARTAVAPARGAALLRGEGALR